MITELEDLLIVNFYNEASNIAHSLKGALANARCLILTNLIVQIENEILQKDLVAATKSLNDIKEEWQIIQPIMREI